MPLKSNEVSVVILGGSGAVGKAALKTLLQLNNTK